MSRGLKPRGFDRSLISGTEVPAYQKLSGFCAASAAEVKSMTDAEREMLREKEESNFGERKPYDSSRQATYEDTFGSRRSEREWEEEE